MPLRAAGTAPRRKKSLPSTDGLKRPALYAAQPEAPSDLRPAVGSPVGGALPVAGGDDVLLKEALFFTGAAFLTFGGAYSVLSYVSDVAVNHYGWLTADQMVQGLGLAESTPGPLIMVTQYVGFIGAWNDPGPF